MFQSMWIDDADLAESFAAWFDIPVRPLEYQREGDWDVAGDDMLALTWSAPEDLKNRVEVPRFTVQPQGTPYHVELIAPTTTGGIIFWNGFGEQDYSGIAADTGTGEFTEPALAAQVGTGQHVGITGEYWTESGHFEPIIFGDYECQDLIYAPP